MEIAKRVLEPFNITLKPVLGLHLAVFLSYIPSYILYSQGKNTDPTNYGTNWSFFVMFYIFALTVYWQSRRSGYKHEIVYEFVAYALMILVMKIPVPLVFMLMFQTAFLHRVYTHTLHFMY